MELLILIMEIINTNHVWLENVLVDADGLYTILDKINYVNEYHKVHGDC